MKTEYKEKIHYYNDIAIKTFPVTLYFSSDEGRRGYEHAVRDGEIKHIVHCKNCINRYGCAICLQLGAEGYCSKGRKK